MKLNNKGITTIEVLICFILVVIITTSMFVTISSFNEKKTIESYKEEVYDYKNILTKDIQDDFIKIGLTHARYEKNVDANGAATYTVLCNLKDGTERKLEITQLLAKSSYHTEGVDGANDYFMIKYGKPDDMIEYPLPDLGHTENESGKTVQDLSINKVLISIDDNNVLSIYIGFHHPDLDNKYAINIICPINYISSSIEGRTNWDY